MIKLCKLCSNSRMVKKKKYETTVIYKSLVNNESVSNINTLTIIKHANALSFTCQTQPKNYRRILYRVILSDYYGESEHLKLLFLVLM